MLEIGLGVKRVALVMEGMGINHAHLKLYPLYGLEEKFKAMESKDRVFLIAIRAIFLLSADLSPIQRN